MEPPTCLDDVQASRSRNGRSTNHSRARTGNGLNTLQTTAFRHASRTLRKLKAIDFEWRKSLLRPTEKEPDRACHCATHRNRPPLRRLGGIVLPLARAQWTDHHRFRRNRKARMNERVCPAAKAIVRLLTALVLFVVPLMTRHNTTCLVPTWKTSHGTMRSMFITCLTTLMIHSSVATQYWNPTPTAPSATHSLKTRGWIFDGRAVASDATSVHRGRRQVWRLELSREL